MYNIDVGDLIGRVAQHVPAGTWLSTISRNEGFMGYQYASKRKLSFKHVVGVNALCIKA